MLEDLYALREAVESKKHLDNREKVQALIERLEAETDAQLHAIARECHLPDDI